MTETVLGTSVNVHEEHRQFFAWLEEDHASLKTCKAILNISRKDYKCSVNFKIACENIQHFNQLLLSVINVLENEKIVKIIFVVRCNKTLETLETKVYYFIVDFVLPVFKIKDNKEVYFIVKDLQRLVGTVLALSS